MRLIKITITVVIFFLIASKSYGQTDSLALKYNLKGQVSAFILFNPDNTLALWGGGRYIPAFNLEKPLTQKKLLDMEVSANLSGSFATVPFDSTYSNGSARPYRAWVRYSNEQMEWRLGLQKINFGSASILRPLMWFDQIDPRDPLQITDGVYGILGRYYFLNNANVWVWGLYGNKNPRGFDITAPVKEIPEFGGRFQFPVKNGEMGLTYHFRKADISNLGNPEWVETPENRFGFDAKWDIKIGLWVEASWIRNSQNIGFLTNQHLFNVGMDYTFGLGNGLNVIAEQLIISYDETAFGFSDPRTLTAISASYPLGLFDNLSAILYYDWTGQSLYNFFQWQHQFATWTLNVMAFWNPENTQLPQQGQAENLLGGKGIQVLAVYNH